MAFGEGPLRAKDDGGGLMASGKFGTVALAEVPGRKLGSGLCPAGR